MNNMFVLQYIAIKALFKKSINVVEHRFNTLMYKKLRDFVSREAQDLIFPEVQLVDIVGTDSSVCGFTLRVTHGLPCACEFTKFIIIYGYTPLKNIHVRQNMLLIRSSNDTSDSWGDLDLTHEVDVLFKRFSQLDVCGKITLKTKVRKLAFPDTTSMCPHAMKIKTKGAPKSVKSTKHESSMQERVNEINTMVGSSRTPIVARKGEHDNKKEKNGQLYG